MQQIELQLCTIHEKEMNQVVIYNERLLIACCEECIIKTINFHEYIQLLLLRRDNIIKDISENANLLREHLSITKEKIKELNLPDVPEAIIINPYLDKVAQDIYNLTNYQLNTLSQCSQMEETLDQIIIEEIELQEKFINFSQIFHDMISEGMKVVHKMKLNLVEKPPILLNQTKLFEGLEKKRSQSLQI